MHTSRDRKRKVRNFESSRAFHSRLTMPLKNPLFLFRSHPRDSQPLKAALNAFVADERTLDGPEDLRHETAAQIGLYPHRGLDEQASSIRPPPINFWHPSPCRILETSCMDPRGRHRKMRNLYRAT